jgi:hypothetical protein
LDDLQDAARKEESHGSLSQEFATIKADEGLGASKSSELGRHHYLERAGRFFLLTLSTMTA